MKQNILISMFLVVLFSCSNDESVQETTNHNNLPETLELTAAQLHNADLNFCSLTKRTVTKQLKVSGQIDVPPQNLVSIGMPFGAYLKSSHLLPGMHVSKNEVLAIMEDQAFVDLQQDYLTTKAKLEFSEAEYQRQKELNQSKATSDKQLQQAKLEYMSNKIALLSLSEKLKLIHINPQKLNENNLSSQIKIYSPIQGFVSKVNVNVGRYVNASDVIFELVNPTDIHLSIKVFERDLDKIRIGQSLLAYNNHYPDKKYKCTVLLISKNLDAGGTAEVHCHFEKYDRSLIPGMYMNALIELSQEQVMAIPTDAILEFEDKNYVFIQKNKHTFELRSVEAGEEENGFVEIKNAGSLTSEKIVKRGSYTLLMALKNKEEE